MQQGGELVQLLRRPVRQGSLHAGGAGLADAVRCCAARGGELDQLGAAVAAHGSWDRKPPQAPAVLWLAWNAAKGTLMPATTLIGGFENANGSYWGRPVDAVPGPDGALYVSDDTAGAIYRLAPPA